MVAILVELVSPLLQILGLVLPRSHVGRIQGEVIARLVVHASAESRLEQKCFNLASKNAASAATAIAGAQSPALSFSKTEVMDTLNRMLQ